PGLPPHPLPLHDALPICRSLPHRADAEVVDLAVGFGGERLVPRMGGAAEYHIVSEHGPGLSAGEVPLADVEDVGAGQEGDIGPVDRKSTRLNSSHVSISY